MDRRLLRTGAMNEENRSADPPLPLRPALWRATIGFILLTLVALVLVPWIVQRRVNALREEIAASEPARTLVMQWQFTLVREMAALTELLLTGDTAQASRFRSALTRESQVAQELPRLAAEIGGEVVPRVAEARALTAAWHEHIDEVRLQRLREAGVPPMDVPRERQLFERALATVARVDSAIIRETDRTRRQIEAAERRGFATTMLLGALTLFAAGAVVALEARVRQFASEAERRRRQAEGALKASAAAADARARLLRGITHDVKNPLGAAKGYAELLALGVKAPLAPEQAPLVDGVERSVDNALAIIADLLDLARVDSSGFRLRRVEVQLEDVAREAVADNRAAAETAGHSIELTVERGQVAFTDPGRVRQVLDNLISNAIKYTPAPGRITLRVSVAEDGGPQSGTWATISVSDTGPGIPPEQREAVFDEFTRLDEHSPLKGHGLGLAVARGIARQLGGDLTIADAGPGATFVLWLPQRGTSRQTSPRSSSVTR